MFFKRASAFQVVAVSFFQDGYVKKNPMDLGNIPSSLSGYTKKISRHIHLCGDKEQYLPHRIRLQRLTSFCTNILSRAKIKMIIYRICVFQILHSKSQRAERVGQSLRACSVFYLNSTLGLHEPAPQHCLDLPICQLAVGRLDLPLDRLLQQ